MSQVVEAPVEVREPSADEVPLDERPWVVIVTREKAELDVSRLHAHGLWATMQQD
jgi:hypothetical protein